MSTDWTVATAATELKLDAQRQGELTFSVSNPGPGPDTAYFFAEVDSDDPGVGGRQPWLQVAEPQQPVAPGQTVSYLLRVAVPPTVPAGRYFLRGVAYSANTAAEETRRDSARVAFEVGPGKPAGKWWIWVVAALLVLIVGGVGAWFLLKDNERPAPKPSVSAKQSAKPAPKPIVLEAESLIDTATVTGGGKDLLYIQANCCNLSWSGGEQALWDGAATGSVTFRFTTAAEGDYLVSMTRTASDNFGKTITLVDGKSVGGVFDGYHPFPRIVAHTDDIVHLTAGQHTLTIKIVDTNPATGRNRYGFGLDQIRLEPQ